MGLAVYIIMQGVFCAADDDDMTFFYAHEPLFHSFSSLPLNDDDDDV